MAPIFHVTRADDWSAAVEAGEYRLSTLERTLDEEGFIHCSTAEQVDGVLDRFYRGVPGLVRLEIDPDSVGCEIRYEGEPEAFPHIYGPLPVTAVKAVTPQEAPSVEGL